jgi:hypothetical protein
VTKPETCLYFGDPRWIPMCRRPQVRPTRLTHFSLPILNGTAGTDQALAFFFQRFLSHQHSSLHHHPQLLPSSTNTAAMASTLRLSSRAFRSTLTSSVAAPWRSATAFNGLRNYSSKSTVSGHPTAILRSSMHLTQRLVVPQGDLRVATTRED